MFTDKELKVARLRLEGLMSKDIAKKLNVSEPDVSQTISRLTKKVKTVGDSIELLMKMDIIVEGPKYILTEKGRKLARLPERKPPKPTEPHLRVWYDFEIGLLHEASEAFPMLYRLYTVGQEQSIPALIGKSEARIDTLTQKRKKPILPTSEPIQPIETPDKAVFI